VRSGFIYGGEYVPDEPAPPAQAPTVLTSATLVTGAAVSQSPVVGGYIEDVSLDLTATDALPFLDAFDVLWGTGDCANDTVFGNVANVPEPAALVVFVIGLMGLGMIRGCDARPFAVESTDMD